MREKASRLAALLGACLALVLTATAWAAEAPTADTGRVPYAVTSGSLYFDPATGAVLDCDATVTQADIPAQIGGVAVTVCIPSTVTAISPTYTDTPEAVTVYAVPDSRAWIDLSPAQRLPMTQAPGDFLTNLSPRNALACLSVLDQDMLAGLLLTDDALDQGFDALEQSLGGPTLISMTPDCPLGGQQVTAVGGRLCARDPQGEQAVLTLGPATAPSPAMPGQHPYSRLFSVSPEGLTDPLRVPMLLSVEVPGDLDVQNLSVLRLRSDGTSQPLDFTYQDNLLRFCARESGDYYIVQTGYDASLTQTGPQSIQVRTHTLSAASLIWTAYDAQGQLLQCGLVPLAAQAGWSERALDVPKGTAWVKAFLLDPETAAPRILPQALILK